MIVISLKPIMVRDDLINVTHRKNLLKSKCTVVNESLISRGGDMINYVDQRHISRALS